MGGRYILLDPENEIDLAFARDAYGYDAEERGWFREADRLFAFRGALSPEQAQEELTRPPPSSVLDSSPAPKLIGPPAKLFLRMGDGTEVTWIRHPAALPKNCRPHWRAHTCLFEIRGPHSEFIAYTSIHSFAAIEGADGKFRIFAPGGIRWVDYADSEAAISDALDMSLAVAMKIQVVGTPTAGNKISVVGDILNKPRVLRAIFSAYERMGLIVTSADLGLSLKDLEKEARSVAPTSLVPMGVYREGISSASVTAQGAVAALKAMAKHLNSSPGLSGLKVSIQGLGEVGYLAAGLMLELGARLVIAEINPETLERFRSENRAACDSGCAEILLDPDRIYDTSADIFFPCALRDILTKENLDRLLRAGVKMIGGPANNLFPDQREGPWYCHRAGLPVIPYEGIGAGGVTGVAYSIMTGIYGRCPFTIEEKVDQIGSYVDCVLEYSKRYDLPPQVVSDRLLFRRADRRRILAQDKSDEILSTMLKAFHSDNRSLEEQVTLDYTKNGLFYGSGRFETGGWRYLRAV